MPAYSSLRISNFCLVGVFNDLADDGVVLGATVMTVCLPADNDRVSMVDNADDGTVIR